MMRLQVVGEPPSGVDTLVAGLPDMGNVAGIAVAHLVSELGMETFAQLHAYWPPYVIHKEGTASYARSLFKFNKPRDGGGFVVFSGEFQPHEPATLYELCEDVINYAAQLSVRRVITLGAAHRGDVLPERRVYYAITREELREAVEASGALALEGEGYITGFNGLLLGIAEEHGIGGICILGEIDNPEIRQPKTAKSVLRVLTRLLGIPDLDYTRLDAEHERIRAQLSLAEEYRRVRRMFGREPPGVI